LGRGCWPGLQLILFISQEAVELLSEEQRLVGGELEQHPPRRPPPAVRSFSGFVGIGQRYHALPWYVLTYDTGKGGYIISATKDQPMSARRFTAGEEPFARTEDMRRIREFWAEGQLSP
jgi:hypothetical protein